jgi:hypothetical protein
MRKRVPASPHLTDDNRDLPRDARRQRTTSIDPAPQVSPEMIEQLRLILERKAGRPISTEYAEESARNLLAFGQFVLRHGGDVKPAPGAGQPPTPPVAPDDATDGCPEVDRPRRG